MFGAVSSPVLHNTVPPLLPMCPRCPLIRCQREMNLSRFLLRDNNLHMFTYIKPFLKLGLSERRVHKSITSLRNTLKPVKNLICLGLMV